MTYWLILQYDKNSVASYFASPSADHSPYWPAATIPLYPSKATAEAISSTLPSSTIMAIDLPPL